MTQYVTDMKAAKSISAYVVFRRNRHIATIRAHHSESKTFVNVFCYTEWKLEQNMQYGIAGGYGYNRLNAALAGMTIDGIEIKQEYGLDTLRQLGYEVIQAI